MDEMPVLDQVGDQDLLELQLHLAREIIQLVRRSISQLVDLFGVRPYTVFQLHEANPMHISVTHEPTIR
jgi:hypothetical protein